MATVNLCFVIFIVGGSFFVQVDALFERYISMISDVHAFYGLPELTLVFLSSRDFSRKGVPTLSINFEELKERTDFYRGRIVRPLMVVLMTAARDIDEFIDNTRYTRISYPIWLVIFADESGEAICEYCDRPARNIFRLRFDTEMLILCCHNPILREWWSVGNNRTETADFATWSTNDGLAVLANEGLYTRRHDLGGAEIRVGIVTSSAFLRDRGYTVGGFLGDVLHELERGMNFSIVAMLRETGFGSWSSATEMWSGVVGHLARQQADIGVGEFTITANRLNVVDFTLPLIFSRSRLYIREPDGSGVQWSAYFQAFTSEVWIAIILLITTTPILLAVIIRTKGGSNLSPVMFAEKYLWVWGIFCQQGLSEFPSETPLRVACISIFASALVVSAAYSASLISFLTVYSASLPFSTMAGFADDGSYGLIVYQNSSDYDLFAVSSDPVLSKMMTLMKPWRDLPRTMEEGFEQVCNENVAFYTYEAGKETMNLRLPCKLATIESGRTESLAMIMAAEGQYTGVVNYHIQRFRDNGMLNRLKNRYFTRGNPAETTYEVVGPEGVVPLLSALAGGMILASVVLLFEKIYHSPKRYGQIWKRTNSRKTTIRG